MPTDKEIEAAAKAIEDGIGEEQTDWEEVAKAALEAAAKVRNGK